MPVRKNKNKNRSLNKKKKNKLAMIECPTPYTEGEPFWGLMKWENKKFNPNFLKEQNQILIFRSENECNIFKISMKLDNYVPRGITKKMLSYFIKNKENEFLLVPSRVVSKKMSAIPVSRDEVVYCSENLKFEDDSINKILENYDIEYNKFVVKNVRYTMDSVLNYIIDLNDRHSKKISDLNSIVDEYRDAISSSFENSHDELDEYVKSEDNKGQRFKFNMNIGIYQTILEWSVEKAKRVIERDKIKRVNIKIDSLMHTIDKASIVAKHYELSQNPIIVASLEPFEPNYIVIDGNHRLNNAFIKGEKEVEAYILCPSQQIESMIVEYDRVQFKVLSNIEKIRRYILGDLKYEELQLYDI